MTLDQTCRIIAIAGGSGAGKTTLANRVRELIGKRRCSIISQDSYYRDMSSHFDEDGGAVNFDHPDSIEFSLLSEHLSLLKSGNDIEIPRYDFSSHTRLKGGQKLSPTEYILLDGTLVLTQEILREQIDSSIFITTGTDIRFQRRLTRDIQERGREPEGVQTQWERQVQPMHVTFVEESAMYATKILSGEGTLDDSASAVIAGIAEM